MVRSSLTRARRANLLTNLDAVAVTRVTLQTQQVTLSILKVSKSGPNLS
jgi:hypothetical protein